MSVEVASVVDPRFLRAPWAEGQAIVKAALQAKRERERQRAEETRRVDERRLAQHARLYALLGDDTRTTSGYGFELRVDHRDLDRLLALAEVGARAIAADQAEDGTPAREAAEAALAQSLVDQA